MAEFPDMNQSMLLEEPESDFLDGLDESTRSEPYIRAATQDLFSIRRLNNPQEDVESLWNRSEADVANSISPYELLQTEKQVFGDNEYTQALNIAIESVKQGGAQYLDAAHDIIDNAAVFKDAYSGLDGVEKIMSSEAPITWDDWDRQNAEVEAATWRVFEEWADDRDLLDKVWDGVSLLAPDFTVDVNDLMGSGLASSPAEFVKEIKQFQLGMDAEEKKAFMEEKFPKIVEAFDNNEFKIAAVLGMYFDRGFVGFDVGVNVGFDVFDFATLFGGGTKAAYRIAKNRNLATKYKRAGSVDQATATSTVAGVADETGVVEKATGMNTVDAAHAANPVEMEDVVINNTIDGIAARINDIKEETVKTIKDDLIGWSANKMSRGEEKALRGSKRGLEVDIARAKAELNAVANERKLTKSAKDRKPLIETERLIQQNIDDLQGRVSRIDETLNLNNKYATAEADLSRLMQGIYSPRVQEKINEAVQAELDLIRKEHVEALKGVPKKSSDKLSGEVAPTPEVTGATGLSAVEGLSDDFVREVEDSIINPSRQLVDTIVKPDALTPEIKAAAVRRVEEKLQAQAQREGSSFANAKVTQMDERGFKMQYELDGNGEVYEHAWTRNDAGHWISENTDPESIKTWRNHFSAVFSPDVLLDKLNDRLVLDATFGGQQASRIRNTLGELWRDANRGLSSKDRQLVDELLVAGDEWSDGVNKGKVFTPAELRSGIETKLGNRALDGHPNVQEIMRSYYKKRALYDEMHNIRDLATRNQLEIQGYRNYNSIVDGTTKQWIVRPRPTFDFGDATADDFIVNLSSGKPWNKSLDQISYARLNSDKLKEEGFQVVELLEPRKLRNGKEVRFGLVKEEGANKFTNLPKKVLNYQAGYVPRIYKKGYYYVKNRNSDSFETLFAFKTKAEARKYADSLVREQADVEDVASRIDPVVLEDRELSFNNALLEEAAGYGGLYTGPRKSRPLMVKEGDNTFRPDRLSTSEATERYLQNIADIMPVAEYRTLAMEQWKNTVNALAKKDLNRKGVVNFDDVIDLPPAQAMVMEQARDYLRKTMSIPTKEERVTQSFMNGVAARMEGKSFLETPRQWFIDNADKDITRLMKGYTFNLTMGWFNLRQLFVQAQNATLAAFISPQHAPAAFLDTLRMRTLVHMPENRIKEAAAKYGYPEGFADEVIKFKQSGMGDAIARTGDFDQATQGIGGQSMQAYRKAAKAGRFFYEEGELQARLMSWNIARRNVGEGASIQDISNEATRMHLNLQAENAAVWQNAPVIGVATQFLQVQAKFLESVMPRVLGGSTKWTAREKAQVLTGQLMLYGTAGVPIAQELLPLIAESQGMDVTTYEEMHPNAAEAIQEGFLGSTLALLGAEGVNATEAVSLLAGLDDNVVANLAKDAMNMMNGGYGDESALRVLAGPTLSALTRTNDAFSGVFTTAAALFYQPSLDVAMSGIISNLDSIAGMTSSWNNARKVLLLNNTGKLLGSRGQVVATAEELGNLNLQEQLALAMGFPSDVEQTHYAQKKFIMSYQQDRTFAKNEIRKNAKSFYVHENIDLWSAKNSAILNATNLSEDERQAILEEVIEELMGPSAVDKQLKSFFTTYIKSGGKLKVAPGQAQLIEEVN